jgi:hypothetical protein
MALLVDGGLSTLEDLRAQDSGVLEVAHGEAIDLTSKLELAQREIEIEVERMLRQERAGLLEQVVVTPALRRWHVLRTLEMAYRDAYFSQLNDRYGERWRAYTVESRDAARRLMEGGVGMALQAMRRPSGVQVRLDPGTQSAATYWLRAAWVDTPGRESAPSAVEVVQSMVEHSLAVWVTGAPLHAAGWNLYAGTSPESLALQNAERLELEQEWLLPLSGLAAGRGPAEDREPDFHVTRRRLLWR